MLDEKQLPMHVTVLGWLNIGASVLIVLLGMMGFVFFLGIGALSGDPQAARILPFLGLMGMIVSLTVLAMPWLVAGIGLLRRKAWGRIVALIVGFFHLFNFPIGTVLGIYTYVVLLQQSAADYFAGPPQD